MALGERAAADFEVRREKLNLVIRRADLAVHLPPI
jgi:hypothetical protein